MPGARARARPRASRAAVRRARGLAPRARRLARRARAPRARRGPRAGAAARRDARRRAPTARARSARSTRRPLVSACSCISVAVGGRPAVGEQRVDGPDLAVDRRDHVLDLERDRLERGARELRRRGAEGEPAEQPDRARRPTTARRARRTPARGARRRCSARRRRRAPPASCRAARASQRQRRAGGADVALEARTRAAAVVPGDRSGTAPPERVRRRLAEAHDRGAGAVGRLDVAGAPAGVGEQRGVRVAHHGARPGVPSAQRRQAADAGNGPRRGRRRAAAPRAGRRRARAARRSQRARAHVEQLRARRRCRPRSRARRRSG